MTNKLLVVGRMYELSIQPITTKQFNTLKECGRECKLYDKLMDKAGKAIQASGYYSKDGFPTFEVYVNEKPLGIEKRFKTDFQITYLPVYGSTRPHEGRERYYLITERDYKNGHSGLEFQGEFNDRDLSFVINRDGLPTRMICNTITPIYRGQELEFEWNWLGYESSYIVSSKGKHFDLTQPDEGV